MLEQRFLDAELGRETESAAMLSAAQPSQHTATPEENVFIVNHHGSGVVLQGQTSQVRSQRNA